MAYYQADREPDIRFDDRLLSDEFHEHCHGAVSFFGNVLVDRRQAWLYEAGKYIIVETRYRNMAWHFDTAILHERNRFGSIIVR